MVLMNYTMREEISKKLLWWPTTPLFNWHTVDCCPVSPCWGQIKSLVRRSNVQLGVWSRCVCLNTEKPRQEWVTQDSRRVGGLQPPAVEVKVYEEVDMVVGGNLKASFGILRRCTDELGTNLFFVKFFGVFTVTGLRSQADIRHYWCQTCLKTPVVCFFFTTVVFLSSLPEIPDEKGKF